MSLICIEKYNVSKKDNRDNPARPKILLCDVASGLIY